MLAWLLVAIPLVSAGLVAALAPVRGKQVAYLSVAFSLVTLAVAFVSLLLHGYDERSLLAAGGFGLPVGALRLDPLAIVMALTVGGISLVVHIYSLRYMAEERGYARFFVLLDLMTAAILLMVAAADLVGLIVAWHLVGVLLYSLLVHDWRRPAARRYGFWTLFTYRLGDLPLILAALLLYEAYGTLDLPLLFERLAAAPERESVLGLPLIDCVALLVALAAFARSAQFPLHPWLPYSMEGPTPVSALMHAGVVNAGGFLMNRFAPIFVYAGEVLHLVFAIGLLSAILGSALMLTQNDVKKSLGYSTMGQMGFMFVECGLGAFALAIYHLIAHGLFKGTLFLNAGSLIARARRQEGVPPDEVYAFVVERRPAVSRVPWVAAALLTVTAPLVVFGLMHWLVEDESVGRQGAIVLLFFGWVTGAQLLFATWRLRVDDTWRLMGLIALLLVVVVAGYKLIEHRFGLFLYPDRALSDALYAAASMPLALFESLIGILTVAMVIGWVATYYAYARDESDSSSRPLSSLTFALYSFVSRELYVMDLYARLSDAVLSFSKRLNVWMRWL
jgi:NADH-quinone oxidoreductase subunit L